MTHPTAADGPPPPRGGWAADLPFAAAAFVGSSLIFVVQPMVAKQLLPVLGGAPAVWTTCVLFFQAALLAGYAWAHFGPRWIGERRHAAVHAALLVAACVTLPIGVAAGWQPRDALGPELNVLIALVAAVGLPVCVLSATSPLLQRWHVSIRPLRGDRVYRLYAIGNVASLLVLLAYPLLIEPTLALRQQLVGWSTGFGILVAMLVALAVWRFRIETAPSLPTTVTRSRDDDRRRGASPVLAWVALSFIPSSLLLGVTTYLTNDVAAVPFLWVVPLAIYLGGFSLAFAGLAPWPVIRYALAPGLAVSCLLVSGASWTGLPPATLHVIAYSLLIWSGLAALYERRPGGAGVTGYYLWIAVGGVAAGLFNSVVAPRVFDTAVEYPLALAAAAAVSFLWPGVRAGDTASTSADDRARFGRAVMVLAFAAAATFGVRETRVPFDPSYRTLSMIVLVAVALCFAARHVPLLASIAGGVCATCVMILSFTGDPQAQAYRSFFGVHRVGVQPNAPFLQLSHGTTIHGLQHYDLRTRRTDFPEVPLTYYHRGGPLGAYFATGRPTRIAAVGLGAGSVAAYAGPGQQITFFEIDPVVIRLAAGDGPFTYLKGARDRGASVDVIEGDARLTLAADPRTFDLVILDAFSGDAVPAHLLTREAFALYGRRLGPTGTLAVHISNRYLDLAPIVAAGTREIAGARAVIAHESRWEVLSIIPGAASSTWIVISRDESCVAQLVPPRWQPLSPAGPRDGWTDDYSNLFRALR